MYTLQDFQLIFHVNGRLILQQHIISLRFDIKINYQIYYNCNVFNMFVFVIKWGIARPLYKNRYILKWLPPCYFKYFVGKTNIDYCELFVVVKEGL